LAHVEEGPKQEFFAGMGTALCLGGYRIVAPVDCRILRLNNGCDRTPSMRFVPLKTIEQQDIQAIHRVRSELIKSRNAKAKQIRGLVAEYGLVAPAQIAQLRKAIPRWLEDAENGLTHQFRRLLSGLREDLLMLEQRIKDLDQEVAEVAKTDPTAQRLMKLQGVGPLIAAGCG